MQPSQLISRSNIDAEYDRIYDENRKLRQKVEELVAELEHGCNVLGAKVCFACGECKEERK